MDPQDVIHGATDLVGKAGAGIDQVFYYNNIAITVQMVIILFLIAGNFYQYWVGNRRQEKDFDRYLSVIQALAGVKEVLSVIKEKIGD
ncbi:MAG: hypothetical protein WBK55_08305 [Alphaproteobacteria bacterium]